MRTVNAILLFVLAAAPLRAQTPVISAADACKTLEAKARALKADSLRCDAAANALIVSGVTAAQLQELDKQGLIPQRRYLGYAVVPGKSAFAAPAANDSVIAAQAVELQAAVERVKASAVPASFDSVAARSGEFPVTRAASSDGVTMRDSVAEIPLVKVDMTSSKKARLSLVQGPPGSGGDQQQPPRQGPPGSGGNPRQGPPGSGDQNPPSQGPPGSGGGNGGQTPPGGGSTPPSRPAPVWRSSFPPPAPNWWNTDFNGYDWWTGLPSGYDRPHKDQSNPDRFYIYSGWHRWRDTFVTNWERTEDLATISRTSANENQVHTRSLTSQVYRESKDCYYQAVYRYDWAQGGFNGSHWEERFDHYKARCIRNPREYGQPRVFTSHVSFDMGASSGQDLPWESDVIRLTYSGQGEARYDFSGAAYRYGMRVDDQRAGSMSVTLTPGAKNLRAPESNKVQAFLRVNAGKVEFVITDDRAKYYEGETLRVTARIIRRVVIKEKGRLWGWNEKNVDSVIHSSPVDILVDAHNPQNITDLTGPASAPKPANAVRSSVFIDSWEFSRVNSRISTGGAIRQGRGNSIDY